ncbi:CHASE domain-containing protein [Methylobacter sp.]|uniref:CHASE domain-containing protein n=1 Tax=Methylobacter sp. TaxID=2051955 RepID=UPI002FDD8CB6
MSKDNHKPGSLFLAANLSVRSYAWVLQLLGLTAAYFITGKLGTFLAIPPGYATAIWPPSGIALAGILIYGYRVWPGILLGSYLVNLSTALGTGSASETLISVAATLAIGGGASLQAVVGAYLVRRFTGFPNSLTREKEVFRLFLFGGLLSTLVNSTIAVSTLVAAGRVPAVSFPANWGTWWMGDALGVFIFSPLVLVWAQQPGELWRNRRMAITLPVIAMFALTTAAVFYEAQNNSDRLKHEFDQQSAELGVALEKSISTHLNILRALGSFYSASATVDRESFRIFVAHSLDNFKGIQALGWNPHILSSERDAFERSVRNEGYLNFQFTERNLGKQLVPAASRPEYVPVGFIEPYRGNETALGYDVYSDALRREAIDRARDSGEIATTARITLVQERGDQYGVIAFMPLYRKGLTHQTVEERRNTISGYTVAVFRGEDIVTAALKDLNPERLSYRLIDQGAPAGEQLIFSSDQKQLKPLVLLEKGLFGTNVSLVSRLVMPIGGRQWLFEIVPSQDYFAYHRSDNAWLILLVGLLLTSMGSAFALVISGRGSLLRQLVDERTAALAQSEERFRSTFEGAPVGVVNVSFDGRFLEVNQGFCDLVGYSRNELLTMTFIQVTHPDYCQSGADKIRQTLAGEITGFNVEKKYLRKDGGFVWGNLSVKLIRHSDGVPDYFVAVIENIDHRKKAEAVLKENEVFKQAILNSVVAEIAVLDHDGVILAVNEPWRRFALENTDNSCMPVVNTDVGANYLAICEAAGTDCSAEGAMEAYDGIRAVLDGRLPCFSLEYPCHSPQQQRWFSMSVTPMGDIAQGSAVITHMDITTRKQAEEQLRIAAIAFECQEGIVVMGANWEILRANQAFTQLTGYFQQEVQGKTIAVFRSDRHPPSFYDAIRGEAQRTGVWQGELWQRRKKGEDYPGQVMITAVKDETGQVTHYVGNITDATNSKLHEQQRLLNEAAHRNALVRIVHHRINNSLQGITGIMYQFAQTHPEVSDPVHQAISQVQSISVIHGLQGRAVTSLVRVCELTGAIAAGVESIWKKPVIVDIADGWMPYIITEEEAVPLALVLNELIWNALKHGGIEGHVGIMLSHQPYPDPVRVTIRNTGLIPPGFGLEDTTAFGTGLQLVGALLPRAGARLAWAQQGEIVVTTLGLDEPVIQQEPVHELQQ